MANTQAPFGFRSFGHRDDASPTMGMERLYILSSDTNQYFTGDPVALSSGTPGYIGVPSTGTVAITGIFAGCEYYNANVQRQVWTPYFPGSVGSSNPVTAYVITDPNMQFIAQTSTSGSAALTQTSVGLNIGFLASVSSQGNTTTGISAVTLASSIVGANSSYPFRIVDLYSNFAPPGVNGTDNTAQGNILVVTPNNWTRRNLTAVTT